MKKLFFLAVSALLAIGAMAQYPTRVYLCGPAGPGWATETWPMYTYVEEDGITPTGLYEWIGDLNVGDLKLLHGSSWEPGYAPSANGEEFTFGDHVVVDRPTGDDPDDKWNVITAGRYKMELNVITMTLVVSDGTGMDDKNGNDQHFKPAVPENVYPIGDATQFAWTPESSEPIAKVEGADVFDGLVFLKNGEFKLLHQASWGAQYGPVAAGEEITGAGTYTLCKPADDYKWVITGHENLTAFHMIADVEAGTLVLRDTNVVLPALTSLYMIGDALGGWDWATNSVELNSEDSVFTYTGALGEGEFKYFEKPDFGAQAWGANEAGGITITEMGTYGLVKLSQDDKFYVMEAGEYTVVADLKQGTMTISAAATGLSTTAAEQKARKMVVNDQIVILKNGVRYSLIGTKL